MKDYNFKMLDISLKKQNVNKKPKYKHVLTFKFDFCFVCTKGTANVSGHALYT